MSSLADLDAAEQDLMLRVSQAYFDVLGAQDTLATTRANKAAIAEQLASAKRNFEVGTATITDTREAQARFDLATAQEIAAENDLVTKRIALDQLVGRSNVTPKQLAVPVVLPAAQGRRRGVRRRARPRSIRRCAGRCVAFEVAQLETEKARAQSLPTVDAVASVGNGRGLVPAGRVRPDHGSIGLQLNMPLYTGGAIQNRIKETLVLEERSRNDLEAARRGVTQTTRQAYYTLQSGAAQVKALEAAEGVEPARAGGDAARLPGRHPRQRRRAQCPEPAVPDPARPGSRALRRAAGDAAPAPGVRPADAGRRPGDRQVARAVGATSARDRADRAAPSPLRSPPSEREGRAPSEPLSSAVRTLLDEAHTRRLTSAG